MKQRLLSMLLLAALWAMTGVRANAQATLDRLTIVDGVCQIGTAEDLFYLTEAVEDGNTELNVLMTADINLAESDYPNLMIGTESEKFSGVFDGQGHTITIHYEGDCLAEKWRGLFRAVDGATIRNLRVEGEAYPTNIHFGALIGVAYGTVLVENVVTNVDVTGNRSGITGDAGMLGANYANITFNNCAVLGPLGNPGSSMYSPFSGWSNGTSSVTLNNCYAACYFKEGTGIDGNSATLTHGGTTANYFNNCYYLNYIDKVQGTQITAEQIESGELCFKLNGDQSTIGWYQTLGEDAFPVPFASHAQVYANGAVRCDGAELPDAPLTYSNTEGETTKPDHQFGEDGICTVCGQNADGYYVINSAQKLNWFATKVSDGTKDLNVLLTADIDLSASDYPNLMIGTETNEFAGIFDGGNHTIHYDYDEVTEKWRGLFAFVKDATIRNLRVEGSVYVTNIHYGALIGRGNGTILVENVVTDVDIIGAMNQVTGDAGMIGANYANITFNNCATLGEMGFEGSSMYSPFSGWSDGNSSTTLNNCYSTCTLSEGTGTGNCFTLTHQSGAVTINNSYYLNAIGKVLTGNNIHQAQITEEQIASGELCYLLNGDQSSIGWYQTLGEDNMPVPDPSHLRVYGAGDTYMNVTDEASFREFVSLIIENETEYYEEVVAQKSLIDTYLEALNGLSTAANIDAFMAGYQELADQRQSIQSCADAYAAYIAKVDETKSYLEANPQLDNIKITQLKTYLYENDEPNENYLNGSVEYILENLILSEEEIMAETALIDKKLTEAITYTIASGTDVSLLFTNTDLSDHFNGWEGTLPTGWGTSETSPLYAAECLAAKMDMYQTVTGLPNGIYELQINGAFRPTPYDDFDNVNYAAMLYTNSIHNFFQTNIEDMISVDDAIDGENCNITGPVADFAIENENGEVIGYTMQGIVSCANAFQAGRYPNYVLCNVTDGSLTIGIRQPGTGLARDWLGFGNIKVLYFGEMSDAAESLDRVLASQSARAKTILEDYQFDDLNYSAYPNFSQALKDELRATLNAVATTTEPEAKYQLIEKFSDLFQEIYECKQAYVKLMDMAEEVNALFEPFSSILSESEFMQMEDFYSMLLNGFYDGSLSKDEVLAIDLKKELPFFPEEEDGYYLINNERDFFVFASLVNGGSNAINGKLLADIDLRETDFASTMIGTSDAQFGGIFDGQGHTVNYSYEVNDNYCGLFRYVDGGTIRNLRVTGDAIVTTIHFGALVGWASNTVLVESVITDVDITGEHSGVTGDGGMFGRLEGNVTFNNCATLGSMGNPGSSMYCGFVAYSGSGSSTLNNCFTACTLTEETGTDYCYTFCRGNVTLNNCYYLNAIGEAQGKKMTLEQFQNGEVCYKLNGDQSDIHWYQTIGEDPFPVLEESHQIVILEEDGTYGNADGIIEVKADATHQQTGIYDLTGRRVEKMQKGIYIVNGKKVAIK